MPIEQRQIMLSEAEVLQALESYRRTRTDFLPNGDVTGLALKPPPRDGSVHLVVSVVMVYGQTRHTISIEIAEADVVHLLIRFCLENNIPIPKIGRKSAGIIDGMLALVIWSGGDNADVAALSASTARGGVSATVG
jgi:hypothetical protein